MWRRSRFPVLLAFVNPVIGAPSPAAQDPDAFAAEPGDLVVLLHGLGLRGWAMSRIAGALRREGYRVVNLTYASRRVPLEELGGTWLPEQLRTHGADEARRVHFVTHSMGGIVVRVWLDRRPAPANLGRVVMLAPPNAGSAVVDRLQAFPPFHWIMTVNGARLGTGPESVPRSLGPWPEAAGELGIIAGDRTLNPLFHAWLDGPNDGKVSVASARLGGARDFIVLHHSHTWLQWRRDTVRQVAVFLRTGRFQAADAPP